MDQARDLVPGDRGLDLGIRLLTTWPALLAIDEGIERRTDPAGAPPYPASRPAPSLPP